MLGGRRQVHAYAREADSGGRRRRPQKGDPGIRRSQALGRFRRRGRLIGVARLDRPFVQHQPGVEPGGVVLETGLQRLQRLGRPSVVMERNRQIMPECSGASRMLDRRQQVS